MEEKGNMAKVKRNSNVESLRILAMLMITYCHFMYWPYVTSNSFPVRLVSNLLRDFGGVGDCIFFGISAWYMCMETPTVKRSFKRVCQLEKQLWFYGIGSLFVLVTLQYVVKSGVFFSSFGELAKDGVASFIPVTSNLWWYTTSYVLFVVMHPMINYGLQKMGKKWHGILALTVFLLWGWIPFYNVNMGINILLFLYQYTILSYIRWYMGEYVESAAVRNKLLLIGLGVGVISDVVIAAVSSFIHWEHNYTYLGQPWSFPSLFIGLGLLMWAEQSAPRHNAFINRIAGATLAPFVITMYPATAPALKKMIAAAVSLAEDNPAVGIVINVAVVLAVFIICIVIGLLQKVLFGKTVNRKPMKYFDILYVKLQRLIKTCTVKAGRFLLLSDK